MMGTLPLEAVSPESLTLALRRSGARGGARVSAVEELSARSTVLSRIVRLRLAYDGEAAGAPQTLIVKTGLPGRAAAEWNIGPREVEFYAKVAAATPGGLLPRCFEAEWDAEASHSRLILEDLGESHKIVTTWPLPPTFSECKTILGAWARFHAHWWEDPRLGSSIGNWGDAEAIEQFLRLLKQKIAEFKERLGDRIPRERADLYALLLDRAPRLIKRTDGRRAVTIVHGDAHVWNCFLPREGGSDVRLFDWDTWRLGVAAEDLAYMMAVHWYPDRRRLMERPLLDAYHAALQAHGVSGYAAAPWTTTTACRRSGASRRRSGRPAPTFRPRSGGTISSASTWPSRISAAETCSNERDIGRAGAAGDDCFGLVGVS